MSSKTYGYILVYTYTSFLYLDSGAIMLSLNSDLGFSFYSPRKGTGVSGRNV
jgi:hypothetical protein